MADLMPGIPNIPGDETTWFSFVDQFETLKKGDVPLSLTNWDDTDIKPDVAAGSAIEIAGSTYRFPILEVILDEGGLVAGTVYVMIMTNDPGPDNARPYFTNTPPVWRDDLNGWYDATGAHRYTGHRMEWDGAGGYTFRVILPSAGGASISPGTNLVLINSELTKSDETQSGEGETFIPLSPGIHNTIVSINYAFLTSANSTITSALQQLVDGVWTNIIVVSHTGIGTGNASEETLILSDGVNTRIRFHGADFVLGETMIASSTSIHPKG